LSFLFQAAQQILSDHPDNLHNVLVLLPNKRGEIFLKRELARQLEKPALAPAMLTIEEFVQKASGYHKQSQLQLLMRLYQVYKKEVAADETFDNFIKWGNTLLHDFNEIDRHNVDAQQLFGNLLDAKAIENWGVEPGGETPLMKNFLAFWKDLYPLYQAFHQHLDAETCSYQGKAYKKVAQDLSLVDQLVANAYSGIYLIGFNALNAQEERIFRHLIAEHNATALWDADTWYLNDEHHEAGQFLRKYRDHWAEFTNRPFTWQQTLLAGVPKTIQVMSAPAKQGMAQAAGRVLQSLPAEEASTTALVLADEGLLLPMLDAIPDAYPALNVTMGLPIGHAAVAQDMLTILRMHEQAERTQLGGSSYSYHHRTFLAVVESSLFKRLSGGQQTASAIADTVTRGNLVFLSPKKAIQVLGEQGVPTVLCDLFEKPSSTTALIARLDCALLTMVDQQEEKNKLFSESAFGLHQLHEQAQLLLADLAEKLTIGTLLRLYQSMLAEHQVDFYGEPLEGLQVMGMLETRTLDFKRVIITSINEGMLPTGKSQNSFIPFDLKRGFGMPTYDEKDAIYAYHFYRLLQRAKEVWLIYDSDTQGVGLKEKSRFIFQVEQELSKEENITLLPTAHHNLDVHSASLVKVPEYPKDEAVLERLKEMAAYGFSPSALAAYLQDPVLFYVDRVLQVKEADEVAETIGYDVLGNVVHNSLEALYKPLVGSVLEADEITELQSKAAATVQYYLGELYTGNLKEGRNLLISKVAQHMVEVVLKKDIERLEMLNERGGQLFIESLEEKLSFTANVPGLDFPVTFHGYADRIDREAGGIYILDYKTGFVAPADLKAENVEAIFENDKKIKAFQVLFYAWLYAKTKGLPVGGITAGIFSTRSPSNGFAKLGFGKGRSKKGYILDEDKLLAFETQLFNLVRELFQATKPFAPRLTIVEDS
jgi:ATP-dependent helicase/nuclease subunit B